MGSALQSNALSRLFIEVPLQGYFRGLNLSLFHHLAILVQHTITAEPIAHVQSHRDRWFVHALCFSAILLHWLVSFCTLECAAEQLNCFRETSRLIPSIGDFAELAAVLLPCMWGFSEIGQRLARPPIPNDNRYARWIAMYGSREFAELAQWCRELLDRITEGLPERELQKLEAAFLTSSRYEWQFWEMAWKMERWQV
jgi:hypothetical protein